MELLQEEIPTEVANINEFLVATQILLSNMVGRWSYLLFPSHHRDGIVKAWESIEFDDIQHQLSTSELEQVGLAGPQLELKMSVLSEALKDFVNAPNIRKLIKVVDRVLSILGSMAGISKVVEQLKEFIEVLQKLIDWD